MKTETVLLFFFLTPLFWAQNKKEAMEYSSVSHTVVSGETVLAISKQYGVNPDVVYRNNRFALDSINEGMVLTFPAKKITANSDEKAVVLVEKAAVSKPEVLNVVEPKQESSLDSTAGLHLVQSGETLYGLSQKYQCTIEELKSLNPQLNQSELKTDAVLVVPKGGTIIESPASNSRYKKGETIKHRVQPKETLYGLSKKYGVSVEAIQKQNQMILKNGLQVNQTLLITLK